MEELTAVRQCICPSKEWIEVVFQSALKDKVALLSAKYHNPSILVMIDVALYLTPYTFAHTTNYSGFPIDFRFLLQAVQHYSFALFFRTFLDKFLDLTHVISQAES